MRHSRSRRGATNGEPTWLHEGWSAGTGGDLGDSSVSVAECFGRGNHGCCEQEEARGSVSAWGSRWVERRSAVQGEELLRDAAFDCDSGEGRSGPQWIFWTPSLDSGLKTLV